MLEYEAEKSGGIFSAVSTSPSPDPNQPGSGSGGDGGDSGPRDSGNAASQTQDKPKGKDGLEDTKY